MALASAPPSTDPAAAAEFASRFDCWFAGQREQAGVLVRAFPRLADAVRRAVDEAAPGITALALELAARREGFDATRTRRGGAEAHAFDFPDERVTTPAAGGAIPEPPIPLPGELMEDFRDPGTGDGAESLRRALLPLAFRGLRAELSEIFEDPAAAEVLARGVEVEAGLRDGSDPAALERDLGSGRLEALARGAWRARVLETVRTLVPAARALTDDELAPAADGLLATARVRARHVLYGEPAEVPGPADTGGGPSVAAGSKGPAPLESRDYASFGERAIALFIDFFGFWTYGLVALQWVAPAAAEGIQLPAMRVFQWLIFGLWMTAIQLLTGRTPGKALLGLKVLEDGRHHTDWRVRVAVREVFGRLINGVLLGAGYWVSLRDAHRRTWGDRMANTVVLRRPGTLHVRFAGAAFAGLALAIQALGWWYVAHQDPTVDPLAIGDEAQRRVERLEADWAEAESLFTLPYEDLDEFHGQMRAALAPLDRCQAGLDALGWMIHRLPRDPAPIEWLAGRPLQRFERYLGLRRRAVAEQRAAATLALSCAESDIDRCMELWGYHATDADALWEESVRALNGDLR